VRVLVTAPAGLGHVHPLLPLCEALQQGGHSVVVATDADTCVLVERTGLSAVPAGLRLAQRQQRAVELAGLQSPPKGREHGDFGFPYVFGAAAMPVMLDDLRAIVPQMAPDVILHDAAELAAPLVAMEFGIRHVTHSFGTTVPLHRLAVAAELTKDLWSRAGLQQPAHAGVFDDIYVDIRPPSLPGHPPLDTRVLAMRPAPSDALGGQLPSLATRKAADPLVYLTLGTMFGSAELLRMAVDALADAPVRVLVTIGPSGDPTALGELPSHMHVERYVPQTLLLQHCDIVASHAGSGTFLGALAHGVPQLCMPQGADQFLNADAAAEVGAGIAIEPTEVSAAKIRAAVDELLSAHQYRAAARRLADEIACMPTPTEVAEQLEQLVAG